MPEIKQAETGRPLPKNTMALNRFTYDLEIDPETHGIRRVYGSEEIAQNVRSRILFARGEWFLKLTQGIPWLTRLLGRNPRIEEIRAYVTAEILQTWGVEQLLTLSIYLDKRKRKLNIDFTYRDIYGNTVNERL